MLDLWMFFYVRSSVGCVNFMSDIKLLEIKECIALIKGLPEPGTDSRASIFSAWQRKGEYPFDLIPIQFEILKQYIENGVASTVANDPALLTLVHKLAKALSVCYADDARYFYSQRLAIGTHQYYMYDVFLKLVQVNAENIKSEMGLFALFLSSYNPSCIVSCEALKPVYAVKFVGPGFDLSNFRENVISLLFNKASIEINNRLRAFVTHIKDKSSLSVEDVDDLKAIFALRWDEVAEGPIDYTKNQKDVNGDWIMVAQLLSGAGFFPKNYYNVLMPTLRHTHDIVTSDPLIKYPLSHYVLSADKLRLILLDQCVQHYKLQKIEPRSFYNCSVYPPVKFKPVEVKRISFAAERFHRYINVFNNEKKNHIDLPLKQSTVALVSDLVKATLRRGVTNDERDRLYSDFGNTLSSLPDECSVRLISTSPLEADIISVLSLNEILIIHSNSSFKIGFCNALGEYQQESINDRSVLEFLEHYNVGDFIKCTDHKDKLNVILTSFGSRTRIDEELNRFYDHRIQFGAFDLNPKYILGEIQLGKDQLAGCVNEWGDYFTQLVLYYRPEKSDLTFSTEIEHQIKKHCMREKSNRMWFRDSLCSQGAMIDRNRILLASILTYSFPLESPITHTLFFDDCENVTTDVVVLLIFQQLVTEIENSKAKVSSADIMTSVILPIILNNKVAELPVETQNWFKIIRSNEFFSNNCSFYDPKHLFLALEPLGSYTKLFLEEVLQILKQSDDYSTEAVRINVKFSSFLQKIGDQQRDQVLKQLANTRREVSHGRFNAAVFNFITSSMPKSPSLAPAPATTWLSDLFGPKKMSLTLTDRLSQKAKYQDWDELSSVNEIVSLVTTEVEKNPGNSLQVSLYIAKMNSSSGGKPYTSRSNSSSSSVNDLTPRRAPFIL